MVQWLPALAVALLLLSGCASRPQDAQDAAQATAASMDGLEGPAAAAEAPTVVTAVRVAPHAYPVQLAGDVKPAPCVRLAGPCEFGVDVRPPGQPAGASAGVEWTTLRQSLTDADGLFWRVRLAGNWTSATPGVPAVVLTVATLASACQPDASGDGCGERVVLRQEFPGAIEVARTDVYLHPGEDTLVIRAEPRSMGPPQLHPADDVHIDVRGWAAAFVPDGEPFQLTPSTA